VHQQKHKIKCFPVKEIILPTTMQLNRRVNLALSHCLESHINVAHRKKIATITLRANK